MKRQNLDEGGQIRSDAELLTGDGHGEISADRRPQLETNRIGGGAIKGTNPKLVLEPAKEQFDLPTIPIQSGDGASTERPLIGPEGEAACVINVVNTDATQQSRPMLWSVAAVESNRLVSAQVGGSVNSARCDDVTTNVGAIPNHKECARIGDASQAPEIDIATVHKIECPGFKRELIEPTNIAVSR